MIENLIAFDPLTHKMHSENMEERELFLKCVKFAGKKGSYQD